MKMIELTRKMTGSPKVCINPDAILYIAPYAKGCIIKLGGDQNMEVLESYEEVKEKLGFPKELTEADYSPIYQ